LNFCFRNHVKLEWVHKEAERKKAEEPNWQIVSLMGRVLVNSSGNAVGVVVTKVNVITTVALQNKPDSVGN